jgi:16S rRNA G966 N2-methylase RsmD
LIGALTEPGANILDPFVGSGTVAVEAQRLGRRCIAVDLNPVSCAITRAKTINKPAKVIMDAVTKLKVLGRQSVSLCTVPDSVQAVKWYTPRTIASLQRLRAVAQKLSAESIERILFDASFSAVLLPVCRETRHWGYVGDVPLLVELGGMSVAG